MSTLKLWRREYADFVSVHTSQSEFGFPASPGTFDDCPYDEGVEGCFNYYLTIQDFRMHPKSSESSSQLPEVLWIGGIHDGDEEHYGTTILMETAKILLESAACEAKPETGQNKHNNKELQECEDCRSRLSELGINQRHRQWMARLVSTRRIVVIPIADPVSFDRNQHSLDGGLSDAGIDSTSSSSGGHGCVPTVTTKTIRELFHAHMFQILMSFHSSSRLSRRWGIGYSWSNAVTAGMITPDNPVQRNIGQSFKSALLVGAGGVSSSSSSEELPHYPLVGPNNEIF